MRTFWDDDLISRKLLESAKSLGRMPSANELKASGMNDLACAIPRHGGYSFWAQKLGLHNKGAETHRGQAVETHALECLLSYGFSVERQTTRAPFDLLVNGTVRINVKSAKYGEYKNKHTGGVTKGFVFGINGKACSNCDLYLLCGVDDGNAVLWKYYVPACFAQVQMITITPSGKYSDFKENIDVLRKMVIL